MISLGVIGEYIGKIYLETKRRPRYIISERTDDISEEINTIKKVKRGRGMKEYCKQYQKPILLALLLV